jgi:hypothetical protein
MPPPRIVALIGAARAASETGTAATESSKFDDWRSDR